jgi:hypothetical protein
MKSHVLGFALLSAIAIVASTPVQAQNGSLTRSFVSSTGSDGNTCMITAPCQTFAQAYTKVGANGIIAALDPGKYGPLNITGPVTINGNGWAAITGPAQNTAISITAGSSDNVVLTGLEIDGAGTAYQGILFNSGGSLIINNCTVQNFGGGPGHGSGIAIVQSSGTLTLTITNTTVSNNAYSAIQYGTASGSLNAYVVIDHVVVTANGGYGIIMSSNANGGAAVFAISNTIASNNQTGITFSGSGNEDIEMLISDSHIDNNSTVGIEAGNGTLVVKNTTINQTPNPILMDGYTALYLSQVTVAIASGFPSNGGIISSQGSTNNAVYSDGTSHLGSSNPTPQAWGLQ